jgi:hypothetical protein
VTSATDLKLCNSQSHSSLRRLAAATALLLGSGVIAAAPANAELGGSARTLEVDRAHLAASMQSRSAATHNLHTLTTSNGSVVREYMNTDGMIFAVAWRGPGRPDLRQLLGPAFDTFQTSVTAADFSATLSSTGTVVRHGRLRRPLIVEQRDLVVHSAGHPGAFFGYAYLPQKIPAGFTPDAFR